MPVPTYIGNPLLNQNKFIHREPEKLPLPVFSKVKNRLPAPEWEGHSPVIECYWKAWELAFGNLRQPTIKNGFISNYIDTAFNGCLFMWDSAFILMFGKYGRRVFNFQATLDNFYAKQHPDGFICREIRERDGCDQFERYDPVSTGPNVLPWSEWDYFQATNDQNRLAEVFPALVAYYQWLREYRTWQNGSYWSSGWGSGMDNMPRVNTEKYHLEFSNAHMVWLDACLQQIFSNRLLQKMAVVLDRKMDLAGFEEEARCLEKFINQRLWDERSGFYYDLDDQDCLVKTKSVAAFWALLAGASSPERITRLVEALRSGKEFNRPHRVPSLSADHAGYRPEGGYWRGGVWPPTNYMILRGLSECGEEDLAHEIGLNHVLNVARVYETTQTVWENYAPDRAAPGEPAKPDFAGWGALPPIGVLLEYVFGLKAEAENNRLVWNVYLTERHGVKNYPFGKDGLLNLTCAHRDDPKIRPEIQVEANLPLELVVRWDGNVERQQIRGWA